MKSIKTIVVAGSLFAGLCAVGCETTHTEKTSEGILGGKKHEETTTTKNPITGDTSTTHTEQKTR